MASVTTLLTRKCLTQMGLLVLPIAIATSTSGQTVSILQTPSSTEFSRARAVWGTYQGGSLDNGYSVPRLWQGTAASGVTLVEPGPDAGSRINGLTATKAVGEGYLRTSPTDGYYAALLWDLPSGALTVIGPPPGFNGVYGVAVGGTQQVGSAESDTQTVPALWTGTTASFVNLLPAGFGYGRAQGTDGMQQVGYVDDVAALWTGSAASFVSLHPPGYSSSDASGVGGGRQVGSAVGPDGRRAAVWQGTAASFTSIHPTQDPMVDRSEAIGISGSVICGTSRVRTADGLRDRAAIWLAPTPGAYLELHGLLPPGYQESQALAVWTDGSVIRVAGSAQPPGDLSDVAVVWTITSTAGTCCTGQSCSVVASPLVCVGMGGIFGQIAGACAPMTCCAAPMGTTAALDCDGDLIRDACTSMAPQNDCNASGGPDSCETLSTLASEFVFDPGPWSVNGSAFVDFRTVVLTPADFSSVGTIVLDPLTAGPTRRVRAVFDFRITVPDGALAGDGFSFALLDSSVLGSDVVFGEEGPGAGSLTVKFNTYANDPAEGNNSAFIKFGGTIVAQNSSLPFTLADGQWHRCVIDVSADAKVTVKLGTNPGDMTTVFNQVPVGGYVPFRARFAFGARTGAALEQHEIRSVRIGVPASNDADADGTPDACQCVADFDGQHGIEIQDIFSYLSAWFAGCTSPGPAPCVRSADVDGVSGLAIADIFYFLNRWFAGC